jgi:hypothetical protein
LTDEKSSTLPGTKNLRRKFLPAHLYFNSLRRICKNGQSIIVATQNQTY